VHLCTGRGLCTRYVPELIGSDLLFFFLFLCTNEVGLGGIKTVRYLVGLLEKVFSIKSINFDLGVVLEWLLEMLLVICICHYYSYPC
jgi:hypothetical protein